MVDDGKNVVRRFWEEVSSKENGLDAIDELFAASYKLHDLAYSKEKTLDDLKQIIRDTRYRIRGIRVAIEEQMLAEGDRVVTRFVVYVPPQYDTEAIQQSAPTDAGWKYNGISISRLSGEKIEESWVLWEAQRAEQELEPVFGPGEARWWWPPWCWAGVPVSEDKGS